MNRTTLKPPRRKFWRFAHEPSLRRTRQQCMEFRSLTGTLHLLCKEMRSRELNQRILLIASTSREASESMREASVVFRDAFSNLAQALSPIKIPPLHFPKRSAALTPRDIPRDIGKLGIHPLTAGSTNTFTDSTGVKS